MSADAARAATTMTGVLSRAACGPRDATGAFGSTGRIGAAPRSSSDAGALCTSPTTCDALAQHRCDRAGADGGARRAGLAPDTPVCARPSPSCFEGVRTAIAAARQIVAGERFAYALCRPPGHHAGPGLARRLLLPQQRRRGRARAARGRRRPGRDPRPRHPLPERHRGDRRAHARTRACTRCTPGRSSTSPGAAARPRSEREHIVEFADPPVTSPTWTRSPARSARSRRSADALVLSLGYDTVAGDPHGSWGFTAADLRADRAPARRIQAAGVRRAGGWLCARLAGGVQLRLRERSAGRGRDVNVNGLEPSARASTRSTRSSPTCWASASRSAAKSPCYKREHEIPMMQPGRVERGARALPGARRRASSCRRGFTRRPVRAVDRRDVQDGGRADGAAAGSGHDIGAQRRSERREAPDVHHARPVRHLPRERAPALPGVSGHRRLRRSCSSKTCWRRSGACARTRTRSLCSAARTCRCTS